MVCSIIFRGNDSSDEADLTYQLKHLAQLEFLISSKVLDVTCTFFFLFVSIPTTSKLENFRACLVGFRVFSVGKALSLRNFAVAIVLM